MRAVFVAVVVFAAAGCSSEEVKPTPGGTNPPPVDSGAGPKTGAGRIPKGG